MIGTLEAISTGVEDAARLGVPVEVGAQIDGVLRRAGGGLMRTHVVYSIFLAGSS